MEVQKLNTRRAAIAIAAVVTLHAIPSANAASATWKSTGHTDSYWKTGANWVEGAAAGATGSTVSDTATFNGAEGLSVVVDQLRNIGSLVFDTADAGAFNVSVEGDAANGLYLPGAGSVSISSAVLNTQTVSARLFTRSGSNSTSYSFTNNSVNSGVSLIMAGPFTHRASSTTTLTLDGDGNGLMSGDLVKTGSGSFNITKSGTGTWTLSGTNGHGNTTLSAGRLNLDSASALGTGTFSIGTGTTIGNTSGSAVALASNGQITLAGSEFTVTGNANLTFGTGSIVFSGAKTINLDRSVSFGGELSANNSGVATRSITVNGAGKTLTVGGFGINTGGTQGRTGEFFGDAFITITGEVRNGGGTQALSYGGSSVLLLLGDNTYTGTTTINSGGTIQVGNGGTTGSFTTASTTNGITNNGTLIINRSTDSSIVKVISGSGDLIKRGAGELLLTRINTFNGDTRIEGGSLVLDSVGTIANSDTITLGAGASLDVTAKSSLAMAGAQEFTFVLGGNSAGRIQAQELDITNAVVDFDLQSPTASVFIIADYTSLVGAEFATAGALPEGYEIVYDYNGGTQIAIVVPEPASLSLLAMGAAGLTRRRRRN